METKEIFKKVVNIPSSFYSLGNISFKDLLKNTGYFSLAHVNYDSDIYDALITQPEVINDWLDWSENKRVDSGWFFIYDDPNYIVGYNLNGAQVDSKVYKDRIRACSFFIIKEIESAIEAKK